MKFLFPSLIFISAFAIKAHAADGYLFNVKISNIAIIARAGGHKPGNMEVQILNGFTLPNGVTCDRNYIATKDTTPGFPYMTALLMLAYDKQKNVTLIISDSPDDSAFAGRCSIVAVSLT